MNVSAQPGIYKITDKDGQVYVGSSRNVQKRLSRHLLSLKKKNHPNRRLQSAWNEHGDGFFCFSVIEYVPVEKIVEREQFWIDSMDALKGYNICPKAGMSYGRLGQKLSAEHKAKIGAKSRLRRHSPETRKKISEGRASYVMTDEHKKSISRAHKGKSFSDVTRARISAAKKGNPPSPQTIAGRAQYMADRRASGLPMATISARKNMSDAGKRAWIFRNFRAEIKHICRRIAA